MVLLIAIRRIHAVRLFRGRCGLACAVLRARRFALFIAAFIYADKYGGYCFWGNVVSNGEYYEYACGRGSACHIQAHEMASAHL